MESGSAGRITELLRDLNGGSQQAADELYQLVYANLRAIALRHVNNGPRTWTLRPTVLVHEAYLRIASKQSLELENSRHFFFVLSRAMRDIVVEHARRSRALRRGGGWTRVPLSSTAESESSIDVDGLDLHEALVELKAMDETVEQVIALRCFAGLTLEQTADTLGMTVAGVRREWDYGVAWLHDRLTVLNSDGPSDQCGSHPDAVN